jgi:hypothetical protein
MAFGSVAVGLGVKVDFGVGDVVLIVGRVWVRVGDGDLTGIVLLICQVVVVIIGVLLISVCIPLPHAKTPWLKMPIQNNLKNSD